MLLGSATRVHLGASVRLRVDKFLAETGGELRFDSGPLVIDRDERSPPMNLRVHSPFGMIALRGTRFFAGPSNGVFGVFVERGVVDFTAGGANGAAHRGRGIGRSSARRQTHSAAALGIRTRGQRSAKRLLTNGFEDLERLAAAPDHQLANRPHSSRSEPSGRDRTYADGRPQLLVSCFEAGRGVDRCSMRRII